jgi:hypothetical protein
MAIAVAIAVAIAWHGNHRGNPDGRVAVEARG